MADALSILEKILKLGLKIKEATDTVRQNKEECQQITTCAVRVSSLLSQLPETGITDDPATCDALEDLEDALRHAHDLVTACQETRVVFLYCLAETQARRLRRAQDDISQKVMLAIFATNIQMTIILTNIRVRDVPPPAAQAGGAMVPPRVVIPACNRFTLQSDGTTSSSSEKEDVQASNVATGTESPSAPLLSGKMIYSLRFNKDLWAGHEVCFRQPNRGGPTLDTLRMQALLARPAHFRLRRFDISELEVATHHFSVGNMIGSGAFATVFKGVLHDGLVVAVKRIQHPYVLSAAHFDVLDLVSEIKHKNIVKHIGYGWKVHERATWFKEKVGAKENKETYCLVEEYMPNESLEKIIDGRLFDWPSRFQLIQGIARGLHCLHEQHIVHFDVKPSNILVDFDMNPKITDFQISRVLNHKGIHIYSDTGTVEGTLGYMPPEYITDGTLSKKHDVYGFGVTLLDTICGMSKFKQASGQASIEWAWEARQAGRMVELLDQSLFDMPQLKEIRRCVEVGLLCTQFDPADRPDMADALEMLRGEKALRTPVRPGYTTKEPTSWFGGWRRLHVRL